VPGFFALRGPSLPQNDRFSALPPRAAGLAGRLKCKKRLLFPYRINVSAITPIRAHGLHGYHRSETPRVPVTVSDKLS
jgi:hypothetical protein